MLSRPAAVQSSLEYNILRLVVCLALVLSSMGVIDYDVLPNMVSRGEWGAQPPRIYPRLQHLRHPVKYVMVSYFTPTITDDKLALQAIQEKHMNAGLPDIQSNFLISKNGTIYEGRGWDWKPPRSADFQNYDGHYLEISYIGNFNDVPISHPIYRSTWAIFEYGVKKKYMASNFVILTDKDKARAIQ